MTMSPCVGLFHRCLQPHLDQLQDEAIADAAGQRFHQLGMGDRVEVAGKIAVDHLGMPASDQPFDLPDGVVAGYPPCGYSFTWARNFGCQILERSQIFFLTAVVGLNLIRPSSGSGDSRVSADSAYSVKHIYRQDHVRFWAAWRLMAWFRSAA